MASKGTFNQGWWNCFEHIAAELLDMSDQYETFLKRTLKAAGITKREAQSWLNRYDGTYRKVEQLVREYWLSLPNKR